MNNKRTKNIFRILLGQTSVALLVAVMGLSILFYAEGYRVNMSNFNIYKTGILYLSSYPKDSNIYIDNKELEIKTPAAVNLEPDYYRVKLTSEGYIPWETVAKIESELVTDFKSVVLIKDTIEPEVITDPKITTILNSPEDTLAIRDVDGLSYNDFELWVGNNLITRFSTPISKAVWYSDNEHIIYQQANELKIIEITGTNATKLITLSSETPTNFFINDKGDKLYYLDNGRTMAAQIR